MEAKEKENEGREARNWVGPDAGEPLDDLARMLASDISRREAIRQIGGTFVAVLLALVVPAQVRAEPPPGRGRCLPPLTRCVGREGRGLCVDLSSDRNNCGACGNVCESPEDLCCDGVCTNIVFDRFNCGACGNVCPDGWDCCGVCTPLDTTENCGCCGCGCLPDEQCVDGSCVPA